MGGQFDPPPSPFGFSKNVSSKERVKPWFFVTFNITSRNIILSLLIILRWRGWGRRGGIELTPRQKKLPLKKPALLGLSKQILNRFVDLNDV